MQEGDAQTDLKHPKNLAIQYEARVFGPEEVEKIWNSPQMKRQETQLMSQKSEFQYANYCQYCL